MSALNARHPVKMRLVVVRQAMPWQRTQARQPVRMRQERWALQQKDLPVAQRI